MPIGVSVFGWESARQDTLDSQRRKLSRREGPLKCLDQVSAQLSSWEQPELPAVPQLSTEETTCTKGLAELAGTTKPHRKPRPWPGPHL